MNTFQRAGAAVGLSLAVGTGAYVAERVFDPGMDPAIIADQYQSCAAIPEEGLRTQCVEGIENGMSPITWLGSVQLGSLVTGIAGGVVAYRNMRNQE